MLGATAFVLAFFHRLAPAAIAGELQQSFTTSSTSLGVLAAAYFYVYFAMQVPSGVLADTWGPRRLFTAGAIIAGVGSIVFGTAATLGVAIAGRLLVGLGVSVAFVSVLKLNAAWFSERQFATMTGLLMFIGNMGGFLSAAPLAWIVGITSWRNVFVAAGAVSLLLAALIWALLRDNPRELGLPSIQELEGKPEHPPHSSHWLEGLAVVLRNRMTWPGFFMNLGLIGSYLTFNGLWAVPYLREVHGMERTMATYHTSVMILGFAVGSFVVGSLSDRLGHRLPLMRLLGVVYAACWIPWIAGWADAARGELFAVRADGRFDIRRHAQLDMRQGSEPAGACRNRDQRGEHRRLSRAGDLPAAGRPRARHLEPRHGAFARRLAVGSGSVVRVRAGGRGERFFRARDSLPQHLRRAPRLDLDAPGGAVDLIASHRGQARSGAYGHGGEGGWNSTGMGDLTYEMRFSCCSLSTFSPFRFNNGDTAPLGGVSNGKPVRN